MGLVADLMAKVKTGTPGSADSIFKDPTAAARDELSGYDRLTSLLTQADPSLAAIENAITSAGNSVQGLMAAKVKALPVQLGQVQAGAAAISMLQKADSISEGLPVPDTDPCAHAQATLGSIESFAAIPEIAAATSPSGPIATSIGNALDAVPGLRTEVFDAISTVAGAQVTTVAEAAAELKAMSIGEFAIVKAQVGLFIIDAQTTMPELVTNLGSSLAGLASGAAAMVSGVTSKIAAEAALIADGVSTAVSLSFLTDLVKAVLPSGAPSCTQQVANFAVDSAKVDPKTLSAVKLASSEPTVSEKVASEVKASTVLTLDSHTPLRLYSSPLGSPNYQEYTEPELRAFNQMIEAQASVIAGLETALKVANKAVKDWRASSGYDAARDAAGATPEFTDGTTTDAAIKATWIALRDEYRTRAAAYNVQLNVELAEKAKRQAMVREVENRTTYGKLYAQVLADLGRPLKTDQVTLYLDTTS